MWDTILYVLLLGVSMCLYGINYRILTPPLRSLTAGIAATFVITVYGIYVWRVEHRDNLYVFHILPIVQYAAYGMMFSRLVQQRRIRPFVWLTVVLFASISLTLSLTIQPWTQYNSYALTLFNVLIVFWSGYYLWRTFIDIKIVALEREAQFWVCAGLFFTSLGNFFVQGLMDYLIQISEQQALAVYWIQELMGFILFGIFLLALRIHLKFAPKHD